MLKKKKLKKDKTQSRKHILPPSLEVSSADTDRRSSAVAIFLDVYNMILWRR